MNNAVPITIYAAGDGSSALSTGFQHLLAPTTMTIIYATAHPNADDADLAITIKNGTTTIINGLDCSDADTPGTWKSTAVGGTNLPINVDAGDVLSFDAADADASTAVTVILYVVFGSVWE